MDESGPVRRVETGGDLAEETECTLWLEPILMSEELMEIRSLDIGHREVEDPVHSRASHAGCLGGTATPTVQSCRRRAQKP